MTIALWCVMVAAILPIVCAGIAKGGDGSFNNSEPRTWLSTRTGLRARANSAQQNSWEALAVFIAGVFAAHLSAGPQAIQDNIALAFIATRIVYIVCYVANVPTLRSMSWLLGFALSLSLFFSYLMH
jgi:uncharacterized MAPEG superfamily protein